MPRALKIILVIVGILIAAVVALAIALPLFFDPNDYKDEIAAAVKEKTGRELTMAGEIELSVFPWLGARIGQTQLSDAEGFSDKPFAEMETVDVRVKLLPLFKKQIEIGTVALDGLRLRLARKANGDSNWDDLVEAFSKEDEMVPSKPEEKTDEGFAPPEFEIGAIEITDAAITWQDAENDSNYELTNFKFSTGRLTAGEPFRLETSFDAADGKGLIARTNFVTEAQADLAGQFYRLRDLSLNVIAEGDVIPGKKQQLSLSGNAEVDMQASRMKISGLLLQAAGLTLTGSVDGNNLVESPEFNGRITIKQFNPRSVLNQLGIALPETAKSDALTSAGLDTQFEATLDSAALKQVLLQLDSTAIKGDASVRNFSNPAAEFNFDLNKINLDDYLPPESKEQAKAGKQKNPEQAASAEFNLDALKDLRLDGRVTAGQLTVANLKIEKAELAVTARDGVLTVEPLGANLYNGDLRLKGKVNASGKRPSYTIHGDMDGLTFGPLLKDLVGTEKLNGLANLKLDITTSGNTVEAIKRDLDGTMSFEFQDGQFNGFNLAQLLQTARANLQGKTAQTADNDGTTPFSRFAASFSVKDGLLSGKGLTLNTKALEADGSGTFNIVTNALNYVVDVVIPEGSTDIKGLRELQGITIPVKLSGNLLSPNYSIDMAGAIKGVARQKLQEERAELENKVNEKIGEKKQELNDKVQKKLQKGLSDFLGGKSKPKAEQQDSEQPAEQPEP